MKKNSQTALNILAIAVGMFGMAYASVPLYNIFCKITGFGGTTQEAKETPSQVINRDMKVIFNTDVSPELSWDFKPLQTTTKVKVGEQKLVFFEARNYGTEPIAGMASYNVTPDKMGVYFTKLKCFCFEQQVINPGEKITFPVSFFIDPEIMNDKNLNDVNEVTLSYTFFKYKDQDLTKLRNKTN
jgi:cytochrome c oxidase assembly protein subunit 11